MDTKLILAPIQGYTDVVYRTCYARHFPGLDEAIAPFISTMGQQRIKPSRFRDVLPENNPGMPVVPQILGNHPGDFLFLASVLADAGHDTVNWNLGCPHSKVAKKRRGSGLLPCPDEIRGFLDTIMGKLPCRLSLKVRLGRYLPTEIFALLPIFDEYPLSEIIVHPRTGVQMYTGSADADAFAQVKQNTRHALVYNGDITGIESFARIKGRFPDIDRFMIGRGILANPFLPAVLKGAEPAAVYDTMRLKRFHDDLFEAYAGIFKGPAHLIGRMKGFWAYLGPGFPGSGKSLKVLLKSTRTSQYLDAAARVFETHQEFLPLG